jgi:AcrR family transcriptional regulator
MRLSKARKEIVNTVMKDTIFEAAGSVLELHGVGGMTMDRVATSAGLAAGSLYNYFRNKEEMLQFVYARLVEPFFELFEKIAASEHSAPEKLEMIVRMGLERSIQERGLIRLLVESGQDLHIRGQVRPRALRILTDIFAQGIREGSFRPHNPAHTARMFHGCYAGLFDLQAEGAPPDDVQEYVEDLIGAAAAALAIPATNESAVTKGTVPFLLTQKSGQSPTNHLTAENETQHG